MTFQPPTHDRTKPPRWIVVTAKGTPRSLVGTLVPSLDQADAVRVGQLIADAIREPVHVVMEYRGAKANPTLVHHGLAKRAAWHVVTPAPEHRPLADLYGLTRPTAARIARLIANAVDSDVALLDNAAVPPTLAAHPRSLVARGLTANPKGPKRPKFIAWVGHSSVAQGDTVEAVVERARELVNSPRWQQFEPGFPEIYVTTYGTQRMVQRGISSRKPNPSRSKTARAKRARLLAGTSRRSSRAAASGRFVKAAYHARRTMFRVGRSAARGGSVPEWENPSRSPAARARRKLARSGLNRKAYRAAVRTGRLTRARAIPGAAAKPIHYLERSRARLGRANPKGPKTVREAVALVLTEAKFPQLVKEVRSGKADPLAALELARKFMHNEAQRALIDRAIRLVRAQAAKGNPGGPRIVYNKLLRGWYVVVGPHQTPLNGRFESKAAAQAWLSGRRGNPKGRRLPQTEMALGDPFALVSQRPRFDAATRRHLAAWLRANRPREQREARAAIMRALADDPGALEGGASWPELERRGRANPRGHVSHGQALAMLKRLEAHEREGIREAKRPLSPRRKATPGRTSRHGSGQRGRGRSNPRAPFVAGERVTVPYTGPRRSKRTREPATVQGVFDDGSVHVIVRRGRMGRTVEEHTFPADAIRRRPAPRGLATTVRRRASLKGTLEARARRKQLKETREAIAKKRRDIECTEAKAKLAAPYEREEPSAEYRAARARLARLEREADALEAIARELEQPSPTANPRHADERAAAEAVFSMWQDRKVTPKATVMKGPPRVLPKTLAELGQVTAIRYLSDKYDGEQVEYEHGFKRPLPVLAATPDAKHMVLLHGARQRITRDGLVN